MTSLLSIVLTHTWAHHEHFPSIPFHLQLQELDAAYQTLQSQHADLLDVMRAKGQLHRLTCQQWQRGSGGCGGVETRSGGCDAFDVEATAEAHEMEERPHGSGERIVTGPSSTTRADGAKAATAIDTDGVEDADAQHASVLSAE